MLLKILSTRPQVWLIAKSIYGWKKGACMYYISTLGGGGGSEGNAYFAHVVRGGGGARGKMIVLLM